MMINVTKSTTYEVIEENSSFKTPTVSEIIHIIFQVCIFSVGLYFQIRTILVCIKERTKAWQIHISHAIVMTVYWGYFMPFQSITHIVPSLGTYAGYWICYMSAFLAFFCYHSMIIQSLLIAAMKYIFIVHTWKAKSFGEERIQRIFSLIHMIYPAVMAVLSMISSNFQTRSSIISCFGNSYRSAFSNAFFCILDKSSENNPFYIPGARFICITKTIIASIINSNIPEGILYYMIFTKMQRQVNPTSDNRPAMSLSRNTQIHNQKLVQVNARVTLVIWILECVGNLTLVVSWVLILGTTSFFTMTFSMIWYYVIISNTFLMNTSYNKERIIEDGWKIVIINSIAGMFCCLPKVENSLGKSENRRQNKKADMTASDDMELKDFSNAANSSKTPKTSIETCPNEQQGRPTDPDIFVISNPSFDTLPSSNTSNSPVIDNSPLASNSILRFSNDEDINIQALNALTSNRNKILPLSRDLSSDSESESSVRIPKSYRVKTGEKILSKMLEQMNDENAYLHYFEQLVEFEELLSQANFNADKKFRIQPFVRLPTLKQFKTKHVSTDNHKMKSDHGIPDKTDSNLKTATIDPIQLNSDYSSNFLIKMQLRRAIVKHFPMFVSDEKLFASFVNSLIEFEEGLVKD